MLLGIVTVWFYFRLSPIAECSRITITNGLYDNILVALHPDTEARDCLQLIRNITEAFEFTSSQLSVGTSGRARFGSLKILIPSSWGAGSSECPTLPEVNLTAAAPYDLYENSDFKVSTGHPFTGGKLPWTKQYKGCENESESIYVPVEFFKTDFDSSTRGRILLAEWAKFRYGVFEEYAYFADPRYPPCYSLQGKIFYTGCSNAALGPLGHSTGSKPISQEVCERLLRESSAALEEQLKTANSSLLLAPHLPNMAYFCDQKSQIGLSPTKHNLLCERRGISEVIFSHNDFTSGSRKLFPDSRKQRPGSIGNISPAISLARHNETFGQGYAFILEDDENMRQFGRLKDVKRAMAQILQLVNLHTNVAVFHYDGMHFTHGMMRIVADGNREQLLSYVLPEVRKSGLARYISARYGKSGNQIHVPDPRTKKKKPSLLKFLDILAVYPTDRWHMMMISSSPPGDLVDALPEIANSPHSLSLVTFDESKEWLQFNRIPNTKEILFLPSCFDYPRNCFGKGTSLFVDYFGQILATNHTALHNFIHKVVDLTFVGETEATFTISGDMFVRDLESFELFLPLYMADSLAQLYSPRGQECPSSKLLNYDFVIQFDTSITGCPYEVGDWKIKVTGGGEYAASLVYTLSGVGETARGSDSNFVIAASLGKNIETEIFPTMTSLPVYASISTEYEQPILNAEVTLEIVHQNQYSENTRSIPLADNGVDPDLAANDGIYSAFITDFNSHPSFHSGHLTVNSVRGKAKRILTLSFVNGGGGALLDKRMTSACCGSLIPIGTLGPVGTATYSVMLPSFRTGEGIEADADISPPSRIQSHLQVADNDSQPTITIEFTAPGADYSTGIVSFYDICCTNLTSGNLDDSLCINLLESGGNSCQPVVAGSNQRCTVSKASLATGFYNGSQSAPSPSTLFCGIRGVDRAGNLGPLSFDLLEIQIVAELGRMNTTECNAISDGCLPVDVFWALIGCIGGLILILFIVVLCWCCLTRQDQKARKKRRKAPQEDNNWIDGLARESLNNVYINQAYIQDANGQLKLVASDGVFHPLDFDANGDAREVGADRRSGTPRAVVTRNTGGDMDQQRRAVSWNRDSEIGMSSSLTALPATEHGTSLKSFPPPPPRSVHSNPVRVDGRAQGLQVPRLEIENSQQSLQSISSTVDGVEDTGAQVYASVFRTGRKTTSPKLIHQDIRDANSFQIPTHQAEHDVYPVVYSTAPTLLKGIRNDTKNPNEIQPERSTSSFTPTAKTPSRPTPQEKSAEQSRVRPLPPVRLDHFPSSESEVYSDMSQIIKTPAFRNTNFARYQPNTKVPNLGVKPQQIRPVSSPDGIHSATQLSSPSIQNLRSPPHHRSMEIHRPAGNRPALSPPPPPIPPKKQKRTEDVSSNRRSSELFDGDNYGDDDDSDNWDNYEDDVTTQSSIRLQSTPGTSYA